MIAREDQLFAQIDQRQLAAIEQHRLDGVRIERAGDWHGLSIVMPGLDLGIHEAVRQRTPLRTRWASSWIAGSSPAMTCGETWRSGHPYVACCGVIWCTSPVFRSMRMRVMLSRLVPVTRTKRDLSG